VEFSSIFRRSSLPAQT